MSAHDPRTAPSGWILRFSHLIPVESGILDLACGHGRHARYFAESGHYVTAVNRDRDALDSLAGIDGVETMQADLESGERWPLERRSFGGVIVANYLHRPLLPHIVDSVAPGGVLLYETFARGNAAFGRPSNPDFLLNPGELLDAVQGKLRVIAYEDGIIEGPRAVQRIAAIWRYPDDPPVSLTKFQSENE